jgi:hypothetical protein
MDKLKPLIKYHFWILSGIVAAAAIGVGVWSWMEAGDRINRQKSDILSAESKAKGVMNVKADVTDPAAASVHPNEDTIQGMTKEIDGGKDEVLAAWNKLYSEQKDLLSWPAGVLDEKISKHFDAFQPERLKFDPNSKEEAVSSNVLRQIKPILPRFMPVLVNAVRAKWSEEDVTGESGKIPVVASADANAGTEPSMFNEPILEWSLGDQLKWFNLLTNFKGRNGNQSVEGTPTTVQVLYLKEDLVLLNGVLEIIKEANKDAAVPSQAAIREINNIMIGKEAHEAKPIDVDTAVGGGAGGAMDEAAGRMDMMKQYMENMLGGGDKADNTVSASDVEKLDPAHLRYVDKAFKPITASQYRQSVTSQQLGADSWMTVVKRVPVRLRIRVDERRIAEILEKCANAKIPLEVRQITLIGGELPADQTAAASGKKGGSRRGPTGISSGSGGDQSATVEDDGPAQGNNNSQLAGGAGEEKTYKSPEFNSHFLVPLEIYGVMKFYSAPSAEAIGRTASTSPQL